MSVNKDKFSKSYIDKVGGILRNSENNSAEYLEALNDLNDWRELHLGVMNEYYDACKKIVKNCRNRKDVIVAERLKRLPTILDKIKRFPEMKLSRLQDVAGVRIVVKNMGDLRRVEKRLVKMKPKHVRDYIGEPRESGYRGKHFIFERDRMLVEVQLRTYLQHLWATTVETTDFFRGSSMKTVKENSEWNDFFVAVSGLYALMEGEPVPEQLNQKGLDLASDILEDISGGKKIFERLTAFANTNVLAEMDIPKGTFYVIVNVDTDNRIVVCRSYGEEEYSAAVDEYEKMERENIGSSVLVSVSNLKKVKEAYPSYFLDLEKFLRFIKLALENEKH